MDDQEENIEVDDLPNFRFGEATQFDESALASAPPMPTAAEDRPSYDLPDVIRSFVVYFQKNLRDRNVYEVHSIYENSFNKLTDRYFKNAPWPPAEAIAPLVDNDKEFLLLYKELYYRHIYSKLQPTLEQRIESWQNYVDIFEMLLSADAPLELELPNQWLWDMIDEFIYQFQAFCQFRQRVKSKLADELRLLKENPQVHCPPEETVAKAQPLATHLSCSLAAVTTGPVTTGLAHATVGAEWRWMRCEMDPLRDRPLRRALSPCPRAQVWSVQRVLHYLHALIDKSCTQQQLQGQTANLTPFASNGLYKMLGYFALVGLLRMHCLLADYRLALQARLFASWLGKPSLQTERPADAFQLPAALVVACAEGVGNRERAFGSRARTWRLTGHSGPGSSRQHARSFSRCGGGGVDTEVIE